MGSFAFFRRVFTLFSGSLLGQLVGFFSAFLLTRLFGPEDFAKLEWFALILSLGLTLGTGRYERAFLLPKSDKDALFLVRRSFQWGHWTTALAALGVILFSIWTISQGGSAQWWWGLIPFGLWLAVAGTILEFWSYRKKGALLVAGSKVSSSLVGEGAKLAAGWISLSAGLVLGVVLGHVARLIHLARGNGEAWKQWRHQSIDQRTAPDRINHVLEDYKEYPTWIMTGAMMNRVSQWIHVALLAWEIGRAHV